MLAPPKQQELHWKSRTHRQHYREWGQMNTDQMNTDLISVNPIEVAWINLNEVGVVKEISYEAHPCMLRGFIGIIPLGRAPWPSLSDPWTACKVARFCPLTSLPRRTHIACSCCVCYKAHPAASNKSIKCVTWALGWNVLSCGAKICVTKRDTCLWKDLALGQC